MILADFTDARILVELRDCLSFAEVARRLHLPPATVSRRVMRMETRAGLRLFDRTTRSVNVTEAGDIAAGHAEQIIAEAGAVDLSFERMRDTPAGTVRLSTPVIFGQAILGPIATEFLRAYPSCDLSVDLSDRHVDLIEENYDVTVRVGPPNDEALVVRSLGTVCAGLYRSRGGLAGRSAAPTTPEDLPAVPMGLLHGGTGRQPELTLVSATGDTRRVLVKPRLVCLNPWLLREAALSSDLVVVLPDIIAKTDVEDGRLQRVLPGWLARRVPVHLAFTSRRLVRPAVRAFIDLASERIRHALKH